MLRWILASSPGRVSSGRFPGSTPPSAASSSKPPGSSVAPLGRRAWPPDPAALPGGGGCCAALFRSAGLQLALGAVLRGVAAAAAVARGVDFSLRCLGVDLPVGDEEQPVQQVVVGTSDEEAAGSLLPALQARTGTERKHISSTFYFIFLPSAWTCRVVETD